MNFRLLLPALVWLFCLSVYSQTPGVRQVDFRIHDLVYDPATQSLYATSPDHPNDLLRLDPVTGAITQNFPIGSGPNRLVADHNGGLWIALNTEGAVRRFNLSTLTAEPKINPQLGSNILITDIAPSAVRTDQFAFAVGGRTYLYQAGAILPDSVPIGSDVELFGNFVFGSVARSRITVTGLTADGGPGIGSGKQERLGDWIYLLSRAADPLNNQEVHFVSPLPPSPPSVPAPADDVFALNREDNTYILATYYIRPPDSIPTFYFTRFDRTNATITGFSLLVAEPAEWFHQLVTIGTNRAAFSTGEKLYLLDLERFFAPGQLQVSTTVTPNPVPFGTLVIESITVSNSGPGFLIDVALTNRITANALVALNVTNAYYTDQQFIPHWNIGILPPGEARTIRFGVTPIAPGTFTNFISANSSLSSNAAFQSIVLPVPVVNAFTNITTHIAPYGSNITAFDYDSVTDRLVFGDSASFVNRLDLDDAQLLSPLDTRLALNQGAIDHISIASDLRTGVINIAGWSAVYRINLDNPTVWGMGNRLQTVLRDIETSPGSFTDYAYSTPTTIVQVGAAGSVQLPGTGLIEYSHDGSELYQVSDFDCSLKIINANLQNFVVERTIPNVGCVDFRESNGRLYFDNGLVLDPATGATITNLNLSFPSFVLPDPSGPLQILSRTNSAWLIRTVHRDTFAPLNTIHLPGNYSPTSPISLGTNRIAFLNKTGEIIIVRTADAAGTLKLNPVHVAGRLFLQFATAAGTRYGLESTTNLITPTWVPFAAEFTGTGAVTEVPVPTTDQCRFYRLVQLP